MKSKYKRFAIKKKQRNFFNFVTMIYFVMFLSKSRDVKNSNYATEKKIALYLNKGCWTVSD